MTVVTAYARRGATLAVAAVAAALAVMSLLLLLSSVLGYRVLLVQSNSMAPELRSGDLILTRLQRPGTVKGGDVVTFSDHNRQGRLVTHRVVETQRQGSRVAFITKGDANSGVEHWTIASNGRLGRMEMRFPSVAVPAVIFFSPWARLAVLVCGVMAGAAVTVRRIWAV